MAGHGVVGFAVGFWAWAWENGGMVWYEGLLQCRLGS